MNYADRTAALFIFGGVIASTALLAAIIELAGGC